MTRKQTVQSRVLDNPDNENKTKKLSYLCKQFIVMRVFECWIHRIIYFDFSHSSSDNEEQKKFLKDLHTDILNSISAGELTRETLDLVWTHFELQVIKLLDDIIKISNMTPAHQGRNVYDDVAKRQVKNIVDQHLFKIMPADQFLISPDNFFWEIYIISERRFHCLRNLKEKINFFNLPKDTYEKFKEFSDNSLVIDELIFLENKLLKKFDAICVNNRAPNTLVTIHLFVRGGCELGSIKLLKHIWKKSNTKVQKTLLSYNRDIGVSMSSAIVSSARLGHADCLKFLLKEWRLILSLFREALPEFRDQLKAALMVSSMKGQNQTFSILLENTVDFLTRTSSNKDLLRLSKIPFETWQNKGTSLLDIMAEIFGHYAYSKETKEVIINFLKKDLMTSRELIAFKENVFAPRLLSVYDFMKKEINELLDPLIKEYEAREAPEAREAEENTLNSGNRAFK